MSNSSNGTRIVVFDPNGSLVGVEDTRDLDDTKESMADAVDQERDRRLDAGIWAFGRKWDSDARSRQNLTGIVAAIAVGFQVPQGFAWRDFSNIDVPVTTPMLVGLGTMLLAYVSQVFAYSWGLKGQIRSSTSLAEIDAVDIEAGWPDGNMDGSKP